jgi:mannose-6-phosphate isomerase-like protein (cupin superfamily)
MSITKKEGFMQKEIKNTIFNIKDIDSNIFDDRWVKFAFGPQGYIDSKSLNLGIVNFSKDRISLNHSHDVEEALYVLSGKGQIKIAGRIKDIKKGDFIFIPKATDHQIISNEVTVRILFIFGGEIIITH